MRNYGYNNTISLTCFPKGHPHVRLDSVAYVFRAWTIYYIEAQSLVLCTTCGWALNKEQVINLSTILWNFGQDLSTFDICKFNFSPPFFLASKLLARKYKEYLSFRRPDFLFFLVGALLRVKEDQPVRHFPHLSRGLLDHLFSFLLEHF